MARSIEQAGQTKHLDAAVRSHQLDTVKNASLVVSASLLMAISAHISVPLFFSPVPITMQPLAILLIAFFLGGNRASAAMVVYLLEGISGLPVFSPAGPGGVAQLAGPTGGFLMAMPMAAFLAGHLSGKKTILQLIDAAFVAEVTIFTGGATWFVLATHSTASQAMALAVLPFLPGEVLKVAIAVSAASLWQRHIQSS